MQCDNIFDRSKLKESEWQDYRTTPEEKGWYEIKARIGDPFESGKYTWAYWGDWDKSQKGWYRASFLFGRHDKTTLPSNYSGRVCLLEGDKWRGING